MLSTFYALESVDYHSSAKIEQHSLRKLVYCLPKKHRARDLVVFVEKEARASFDKAVSEYGAHNVTLRRYYHLQK